MIIFKYLCTPIAIAAIMTMTFDFPWYYLFFCVLAGIAYGMLLYFRCRDFEKRTLLILSLLRFFGVAFIAFLFLAPLSKRNVNQLEKPIVVVAQDNSQSLLHCADSAYYLGEYAAQMERTLAALQKDYDIVTYTYGTTVQPTDSTPTYDEKSTNLAALLQEVTNRYSGRNIGALLLSGDGIYNQGLNPITTAEQYSFPIYTIAMGDTMPRCDATIADVRCNRIAYMGNQFPMEITLRATRLKDRNSTLTVTHNGTTLLRQPLSFTSDNFITTIPLLIDADHEGLQRYTIALTPCPNEVSLRNNQRTITVEVIDGKEKIALVAAAPHPDVAALRRSIEQNQNLTVETFLVGDAKLNPTDYNLAILHSLPTTSGEGVKLVDAFQQAHVPMLFIIGMNTDLARFSSLHCGMEIHTKLNKQNEVTPIFNSHFTHFTLSEELWQQLEQMPPLSAPFGDYRLSGNTQSLFSAKIGTVESQQPLMAFAQQQDLRYGFIVGEGLWKWRLYDYQTNSTHSHFDALVNKALVFTSLKVSKEQFHVTLQQVYREGEPIIAEAELYNNNYEPINTPDAKLTLSTKQQKQGKEYLFNRSGNGYLLNLGTLPPDDYHYTATTSYNGKTLTTSGSFVVEDLNLEENDLVANHALLNTLATTTGGAMLMPTEVEQLPTLLSQRHDIKSVIYIHTRYTELINLPVIFLLLVLLLGAEWVLRKYNGSI